jgi:acetyltransferase-like isoleucine patch superfamily enzyme
VIVEHDNNISDFVTVSPGAVTLGGVYIGSNSWIGAGAIVGEDLKIGKNTVIGMGSLVTKNIPDNVIAYGSPAKVIKKK